MRPSEVKILGTLSAKGPMTYSRLHQESGIVSGKSFNDARKNLLGLGLIRRTGKNDRLLAITDAAPRELVL
jgi:hypothetical protein